VSLFLPSKRPVDDVPVGLDLPFEEEFALAKLGIGSPYQSYAFPREGTLGWEYLDFAGLSSEQRGTWERGLMWLMRRFQMAHPGKRLVIKSPAHTARVATLIKLFPQARFIHIARNPFEIYPSFLLQWKAGDTRFGLQTPPNDDRWLPEHTLATLPRMYAAYERDRRLIPPGHLCEITYEDLIADPEATLARAYKELNLGDFAPVKRALDAYLDRLGVYQRSPRPISVGERRAILDRWSFYFDRFGYSRLRRAESVKLAGAPVDEIRSAHTDTREHVTIARI